MLPPGYGSPFPGVASVPPNAGPPFPAQPAAGYGMPPPSRPPLAQQRAPAPRVVRGQQPDEPLPATPAAPVARQAPLRMPSPQELGVAEGKERDNAKVDWTALHARLDQLGATSFHVERGAGGVCRITCLLPTRQPGRSHRIDVEASSEAGAVRLALDRAQEWAVERSR